MLLGVMGWLLFPPEDADAVLQDAEVWLLASCTRVPIAGPNDFVGSEGGTEDFSHVIIPKRDERCFGAVTIRRTSNYGHLQDGPKVVSLLVLANSKDPLEILPSLYMIVGSPSDNATEGPSHSLRGVC
jgi:hypothetical protein